MNQIKKLLIRKKTESEGEIGKEIVEVEGKTNKKKIENLVFFLVILIVTLIAMNAILGKGKTEEKDTEEKSDLKILAQKDNVKNNSSNDELEKKLEQILETMYGVRESKCTNYLYTIK